MHFHLKIVLNLHTLYLSEKNYISELLSHLHTMIAAEKADVLHLHYDHMHFIYSVLIYNM